MTALSPKLGLSLATAIAVVALGPFGMGSAQAAPTFAAGAYPATFSGAQVESVVYELGSNEVSCSSSTFSGSMSEAETMLVLTPNYEGCHAGMGGFYGVDILFKKCFYTVEVTKKLAHGELTHSGGGNLECPGTGEEVEFQLRNPSLTLVCAYTVAPGAAGQMWYGTMAGPPKDLTTEWELSKLTYQRRVGSLTNCGTANGAVLVTGKSTVKGFNEKGMQVDLEVTGS